MKKCPLRWIFNGLITILSCGFFSLSFFFSIFHRDNREEKKINHEKVFTFNQFYILADSLVNEHMLFALNNAVNLKLMNFKYISLIN